MNYKSNHFLGVKQQFSDWIETNLKNVDADKNEFYILKGKTFKQGGRPTDEHIIKLEIKIISQSPLKGSVRF
ncbi:antA/AntB antirepressor family protein [Clostridioides difficile]|uniref:antA/AntB antirepressor family protein n=1 Tax=Clostridioides difficile TaxID=1496 RepID=UPI003AA931AA